MPPRAKTTRVKAQTSPNDLADQFSTRLNITSTTAEPRSPSAISREIADKKVAAMRVVNSASQELSSILKSGWKKSSEPTSKASSISAQANSLSGKAQNALSLLREVEGMDESGRIDVERAAGSLISKLVALELYELADIALRDTQPHLRRLYHSEHAGKQDIVCLPIPSTNLTCNVISTLLTTYLAHAIVVATHTRNVDELCASLRTSSSILSWAEYIRSEQRNAILTRTYLTLLKATGTKSNAFALSSFHIRHYAFSCLSHVSTVEGDSFWEQVVKCTKAFIASGQKDGTVTIVLEAYQTLIDRVKSIDRPLLQGHGFIHFCENWLLLAKRAGDIDALGRVQQLMQSSIGQSDNETDPILEAAQLSANLQQATAALEQFSSTSDSDYLVKCLETARQVLKCKPDAWTAPSAEKVARALDRLRRACTLALEKPETAAVLVVVRAVLDDIMKLLEVLLAASSTIIESCSRILDSLFVLSRVSLRPLDPTTYAHSYEYIDRAKAVLNSAHVSERLPSCEKAKFLRCISSAAHILSVRLYQEDKHGAAIKFLRDACTLGETALSIWKGKEKVENTEDEKELDRWKQLKETLYRRWELLGVCFSKAGNRKGAFDSFAKCIVLFPFSAITFVDLTASSPLRVIFDRSPALKQIGVLVDRFTHLGAVELLLDPSVICIFHHDSLLPGAVAGALMERQLNCLEGCLWKEGVKPLVATLLKALFDVYTALDMPVRRARVLVKYLEFSYYAGEGELRTIRYDKAEEIGAEIDMLCCQKDLHQDATLSHARLQYTVATKLWLALHAHRASANTQGVDAALLVQSHIEEACTLLQTVSSTETATKCRGPSSKGVKVLSKRGTRKPAKKAPKVISQEPKTPRSKTQKVVDAVSLNLEPSVEDTALPDSTQFDDLGELVRLIETASQLAGLLGLILPKVHLLHTCRRLLERQGHSSGSEYVLISVELASELHKIGRSQKATSIYSQLLQASHSGSVHPETRVKLLLRCAEAAAESEDVTRSYSLYHEASSLNLEVSQEDRAAPTLQRIISRVCRLERSAIAAQTFSMIQHARADYIAAVRGLQQSLRLWHRAVDTLSRINPTATDDQSSKIEDNPFQTNGKGPDEPLSAVEPTTGPHPQNTFSKRDALDNIEWRMSMGLLRALSMLCRVYFKRGSPREAEYFAQQCIEFSASLHLPAMISTALSFKAEIQLHQGLTEEGKSTLAKAVDWINDRSGVEVAELHRLQGEWSRRNLQEEDAVRCYERAVQILRDLNQVFKTFETSRKSITTSPLVAQMNDFLAPELLASILRQQVWLLRHEAGDEFSALLVQCMRLPQTHQVQLQQNALIARLSLYDVFQLFQSDMFLSSMSESTIALSTGMKGDQLSQLSPSSQEILHLLDSAENHFRTDLSFVSKTGEIAHIRETLLSLALVKSLQSSFGNRGPECVMSVLGALDASAVIGLRRDLLECIPNKFDHLSSPDDLIWNVMEDDGTPVPPIPVSEATHLRGLLNFKEEDDIFADVGLSPDRHLREYWETVRLKHSADIDESIWSSPSSKSLPTNWTMIHINITPDRNTLFVSRQRGSACACASQFQSPCKCASEPLVFCIPLKDRRETGTGKEAEEQLSFKDALHELSEIIRLSDEATRGGASIRDSGTPEERKQWWKERSDLDQRIKALVENIEFCWFGAFKTIFSARCELDEGTLLQFRDSFDKVFARCLRLQFQDKKKSKQTASSESNTPVNQLVLDDILVECLSSLSPKCRDEELEDLVYFVLDLFQFHGIPVAIAEIDIDQVVMDLRVVLEECATKRRAASKTQNARAFDEHIFLVLGKDLQGIPWESIPILRGRSVSRIPDVQFLNDRVAMSNISRRSEKKDSALSHCSKAFVDPRKAFYILNPSGDLVKTEARFKDWVTDLRKVGWDGVCGKPPSEQQFLNALSDKDLVVYFGHGGGEQYVRSHRIRNLPRCAATMLWGCSSGALRDMGDFDRTGVPNNYMLAGCPTLVANLWDITDRDIDKFSQSVFDRLGLRSTDLKTWNADEKEAKGVSIVAAVARSRDVCKLKYLTGAAPVVYGIPFYL